MQRIFAVCLLLVAAAVVFTVARVFGGAVMVEFQTGEPFALPRPWTVYASMVVLAAAALMVWAMAALLREAWCGSAPPRLWAATIFIIAGVGIGASPIWLDYPLRFGASLAAIALGAGLLIVTWRATNRR